MPNEPRPDKHAVVEDGPKLGVAMRFMEHGSIIDVLTKKPGLLKPWATRIDIALGVADAIECLHKNSPPVVKICKSRPLNISTIWFSEAVVIAALTV